MDLVPKTSGFTDGADAAGAGLVVKTLLLQVFFCEPPSSQVVGFPHELILITWLHNVVGEKAAPPCDEDSNLLLLITTDSGYLIEKILASSAIVLANQIPST